MTGFAKMLRGMRVFEFEVVCATGVKIPLIGIDRDDGLRERIESTFQAKVTRTFRPRNIGLLIDRQRHKLIVTNAENAGYTSTELMKILNQTGFDGELLFLTSGNTYPLHLLRRLNNLALDFDLATISVATLENKLNSHPQCFAQDELQSSEIKSAVG